jgi:tetratricopeptide (TPR) repeat protein
MERMLQAAHEAWVKKDFPKQIELLERAVRLNPSNANIYMQLGKTYGNRYDFVSAEACFEKAIRVSPNKTEAMALVGITSRNFSIPAMSERYLTLAASQKNVRPEILLELAELYERLRRNDEAAGIIERVLQANPTCATALLAAARLARQAGRLDQAEKQLRGLTTNAEPAVRVRAGYELGTILDRQGKYDEAMSAFQETKSLLRPHAGLANTELKAMRSRIRHLVDNASDQLLQKWFDQLHELGPLKRLALLGGHPRSGTTLLEQVLDSHPDILSAEETEIFYDDAYAPLLRSHPDDTAMFDGLAAATSAQLKQSRQSYFQSMELSLGQPLDGRLLVDKNPSYTFLVPALIRIFPEIKLLIAVRDPRDVVLSCFMQNLPLNQVGAAFLSLGSAAIEYSALMTHWLALAPRIQNPHLQVRYEDMVDDLESVARKALEFLGVSWDDRVLGFTEHARMKAVRSPTYADVTQPVYKRAVGRWHHYHKYLEPHLATLEPLVKALGYE